MAVTEPYAPLVPAATAPGDIVGLTLQNTGSASGVMPLTFGEVFGAGAVLPTDQLVMIIAGQSVPVQMNPMTFNADGSVAIATITAMVPSMPAGASEGAVLALAPPGTPGSSINLENALKSYSLSVNLDMTSNGATTAVVVDAVAEMEQALADGTAKIIRSGPLATEASVRIPVSGSFAVTADITAYSNGTFSSEIGFDNDATALGGPWLASDYDGPSSIPGAGTVTYDETIVQNGATVSQENGITQYQYQNWNTTVGTAGSESQINIQHDIAYLEKTGAIPNYDPTVADDATNALVMSSEARIMASSTWGAPLSPNGVSQYMPGPGGRPDIGPTTAWDATWLQVQSPSTREFALGQAAAAGAVPWNLFNPNTGDYFTTDDADNIWADPGHPFGTSYPVPAISNQTGWAADPSHQPDLTYIPYLLTGDQVTLNELNAEAAYSETAFWPNPGNGNNGGDEARDNGQGLLGTEMNQVRGTAWSLREVDEAAYANPPGSEMQQYFQKMEDNNYSWMVSQLPTWTAQEGSAYGWYPGNYGSAGALPPWQQDYLASTIAQAALQGNQDAKTVLGWMSHFLVGRFLNADNGFNPRDGVAYNLLVVDSSGKPATTWAEIEANTEAANNSNVGNNWLHSNGDYAELARESLSDLISVFESPDAIKAYGWLINSGAPYVDPTTTGDSQFDIVPRLVDGNLLTHGEILLSTDAAGTTNTLTLSAPDALIEAGAGNDTVMGGSGVNILFGGSGSDVLVGGPGSDYLYGGSGSDTLAAGTGTNYLDAGTGPTTFLFDAGDAATNTLDGFRPGTDHLDVVNAAGEVLPAATLQTILAGAQSDGAGGTVLQLSPSNTLTLTGVAPAALDLGIFGTSAPVIPPPAGGGSGTGSQSITLTTSGNDVSGGDGLFTVVDEAGGNTVHGGTGGLDLTQTAGADVVTTASGATDQLSLVGQDTVAAAGNDTISALGAADVTAGNGALTFIGGAGTSTITGGSGNANITGGGGGVSVAGGIGSMVIANGGGPDTIAAGSGNVTLKGGAGTLRFTGGSGTANIDEGSGGALITFGSGDATVAAGTGSSMFLFDGAKGGGDVTINNFSYGLDSLNFQDFSGSPITGFAFGATAETLNLSDGTKITLNFATH